MGNSSQRDRYFQRECQRAPTPEAYIKALIDSPYKTHRRMALLLIPELDRLIEERTKQIEAEERQTKLDEFERTLKI